MRSIVLQTSLYCAMVPGLLYAQPSVTTTEPPFVEIGGSMQDPGDQLFAVSTARFLSDGRTFGAVTHDPRVRLYDARAVALTRIVCLRRPPCHSCAGATAFRRAAARPFSRCVARCATWWHRAARTSTDR
jgi:hypothetical protein